MSTEIPAAGSRRLILIRHGRAEPSAASDLARRLVPAGRAAATALGRWLGAEAYPPDVGLVSLAVRAQETWAAVTEGLGAEVPAEVDRAVYDAGADTALDLIRATAPELTTLAVVGHNPTIATMAQLLDDGEGDPAAALLITGGYPPATAAVFEFTGGWQELDWAGARLVAAYVGRG